MLFMTFVTGLLTQSHYPSQARPIVGIRRAYPAMCHRSAIYNCSHVRVEKQIGTMTLLKAFISLMAITISTPGFAGEAASRDYSAGDKEMVWVAKIFPDARIVPRKEVKDLSFVDCVRDKLLIGDQAWKLQRAVNFSYFGKQEVLRHGFTGFLQFPELAIPEPDRAAIERYGQFLWKNSRPKDYEWNIARDGYINQQELKQFWKSTTIYDCLESRCGAVLQFQDRTRAEAAETWRRVISVNRCLGDWTRSADPRKTKRPTVMDAGISVTYAFIASRQVRECQYQDSSDDWLPAIKRLADPWGTF